MSPRALSYIDAALADLQDAEKSLALGSQARRDMASIRSDLLRAKARLLSMQRRAA